MGKVAQNHTNYGSGMYKHNLVLFSVCLFSLVLYVQFIIFSYHALMSEPVEIFAS